jgi:hypothetical protein
MSNGSAFGGAVAHLQIQGAREALRGPTLAQSATESNDSVAAASSGESNPLGSTNMKKAFTTEVRAFFGSSWS